MRWGCFGWPHCGQRFRRGASIRCVARRLSRRDLDCFFLGTATAAQYSRGLEVDSSGRPEGLQQAAVVRDEDDRALVAGERGLELLDRREVEMVGRLVQDEAVDSLRRGRAAPT